MKKTIALVISSMMLCSCAFVSTHDAGRAVGNATYLAYEGVAAHQDEDFRKKVEVLWEKVNSLQSVEQMITEFPPLKEAFDEVLACPQLTDEDRKALTHIRDLVVQRVVNEIGEDVEWSDDAIEFLVAVREGVNEMAEMYAK